MAASALKAGAQWTPEMLDRLRSAIWQHSDKHGIPLGEMAEEAGHEEQLLRQWVNKATRPELPALVDVAEYMDLSLDWVFFGIGEPVIYRDFVALSDWRDRIADLFADDYRRTGGGALHIYAERFGTTPGSIRYWVKDRKLPPRDALLILLKRTGVSADWLIYGIGEKYRDGRASA